jgi:hypothetical protein
MIIGVENSRPFETRANLSGTVYLHGSVGSKVARSAREVPRLAGHLEGEAN